MDLAIWWLRKKPKYNWGKVGCWVQQTSIDCRYTFDNSIDWFICSPKLLPRVYNLAGKRKIILGLAGYDEKKLMDNIIRHHNVVSGIVWDYEIGSTEEQALEQISKVHSTCRQLKLPFGIAVLAGPAGSLKKAGIDYSKANQFCDFLMPMLYCQWWNNDPTRTYNTYLLELKSSSVPLIPLLARETISSKIKDPLLTNDLLLTNYKPLTMPCFAVWNVANTDSEFWATAKGI